MSAASATEQSFFTPAQWRRTAFILAAGASALYVFAIMSALRPGAYTAAFVVINETLFFLPLVVPAIVLAALNRRPPPASPPSA